MRVKAHLSHKAKVKQSQWQLEQEREREQRPRIGVAACNLISDLGGFSLVTGDHLESQQRERKKKLLFSTN